MKRKKKHKQVQSPQPAAQPEGALGTPDERAAKEKQALKDDPTRDAEIKSSVLQPLDGSEAG